jgi:two-component sensor histidine kinase
VILPNDRAVSLGLVVTELVINATKYAYDQSVGPLQVRLSQDRQTIQLVVADKGKGRGAARKGFGSRMLDGLVAGLEGTLVYEDAKPGTRAVLVMPVARRG